jgi:transcription elongation factor SPT6
LDNGLEAKIDKANLDGSDRQISDLISVGMVIQGRIEEILEKEEMRFGVTLNCKRKDLESHKAYIAQEPGVVYAEEDLINHTFKVAASSGDRDSALSGARRFVPRRVNHPKFMNVNSAIAVEKLRDVDIGEFIFRPSSKGVDNITLTWKFYQQNIVHIDIQEHNKTPGASIGTKLQIGREDLFENLQEIVERYIQPSNKFLRDAMQHPKFVNCTTGEELDTVLKEEKGQDPNRIPYKFTVLPDYPQHLVLGYIPKLILVKEYIKVTHSLFNLIGQTSRILLPRSALQRD